MAITGAARFENFRTRAIIFISSAADNMNIIMAMNLGADDFCCQKPFDLNVLLAKYEKALRRSHDFALSSNVGCVIMALLDQMINTLSLNS